MLQTLIHKKVHIGVVLGGLIAGTIVFQSVLSKDASNAKITSLSPSQGPVGTEIRILGSGFATSLEGISGTKVKETTLAPGNYVLIKDEVIQQPLISADGNTLDVRIDLTSDKLLKLCGDKFGKKKPEPCKVQIKVINAYGKPSNEKEFLITESALETPPPAHGPAPTVSILSPTSGRGWVPNTDMYIKIQVANYSDPVTYGELMFNLVDARSIVQTFSYDDVSFDIDMPANGQPSGPWPVPSSLPAGSNYTLEAYFANFPKNKTVSAPFSILGSSVTVNGQVVDAYTGAPIQATLQYIENGITQEPLTDASGNFSITEPTTDFLNMAIYARAACHMANPSFGGWHDYDGGYLNNPLRDNAFGIIMSNEIFIQPEAFFVPVTGSSVNITMREWPAVDLVTESDIPVTVHFSYGSREGGSGPSFYSKSWPLLTSVIPLDQDTTVTFTAEDGTSYTSPILHLPRDHGCAPVTLTFTGGQFTWQP